jgi:hypothetical protein
MLRHNFGMPFHVGGVEARVTFGSAIGSIVHMLYAEADTGIVQGTMLKSICAESCATEEER